MRYRDIAAVRPPTFELYSAATRLGRWSLTVASAGSALDGMLHGQRPVISGGTKREFPSKRVSFRGFATI